MRKYYRMRPWDLEDMSTLLLLGAIAGFGLFVLLNAALI